MTYVVLMRKVNVGKANRVAKKTLEMIFRDLGFEEVRIYINSGNVIMNSKKAKSAISKEIDRALLAHFGEKICFLIKTKEEMKAISEAIPQKWENDNEQKTDIAYLFDEIDSDEIIKKLPFKKEYVDVKYVKGAVIWNVKRVNQGKSQMTRLTNLEIYQFMTVRNVNTARYLGNLSR